MSLITSHFSRRPSDLKPNCLEYRPGLDVHVEEYELDKTDPFFVNEETDWLTLDILKTTYPSSSAPSSLKLPAGYHGFSKETSSNRFLGYIPLFSLFSAFQEWKDGWHTISQLAITNDNRVHLANHFKDPADHLFANLVTYRAHLKFSQRIALLATGVAMIFRAVINSLQIGILFAPIDLFVDWYATSLQEKPITKKDFQLVIFSGLKA